MVLLLSLQSCGQETYLPKKNIYQVVKDEYITTLKTLELKGSIKSVIEEYGNSNLNDTIIDFSKYELTNSNVEKERGFISQHITKFYKANFNKSGYITNSISCKFDSNDSIFIDYKYDKNDLPIIKSEYEIDYYDSFGETKTWTFSHIDKYIYDENKNLTKIESKEGKTLLTFAYFPEKMQIKVVSNLQETDTLKTYIKTYDKYGLLLSDQSYNHINEKDDLWIYEYDKSGKIIKEKLLTKENKEHIYNVGKTDTTVKVYRIYDKKGNCIERIVLDKKGNLAVRKLTIEYY